MHSLFIVEYECAVLQISTAVIRELPQEHLAGSTVSVLIECVHLKVMLIGCGSLWLDVGPGSKQE